MAHQLFCINGGKQYNITPINGSLSWKSSTEQLGMQLDFEDAFNDDRYFPINPVNIGSMMILRGDAGEVFRGIVVDESKAGRAAIQYTALDPAFYLNQSKGVYQFNRAAASTAITRVLNDFNVPIGSITSISTPITKIYTGDGLADIIKDIITQAQVITGVKYRMEMRAGLFYIQPQADLVINPTFTLAVNLAPTPITAAISNPQRKRSIQDMRNSIVITCNDQVVYATKNQALIKQYGQLQEVESVDEDKRGTAPTVAATLLADLGRVMEDISFDVPGSDELLAGRLIPVTEPLTGLSGNYLIKEVTQTIQGGIHAASLNLGVA